MVKTHNIYKSLKPFNYANSPNRQNFLAVQIMHPAIVMSKAAINPFKDVKNPSSQGVLRYGSSFDLSFLFSCWSLLVASG